jgi:hypothetical protein
MSPRELYYFYLGVWWLTSFACIAIVNTHTVLAITVWGLSIFGGGYFLRRLRCPRCGFSIAIYSSAAGLPLAHCQVCKLDLRQPYRKGRDDAA